MVCRLVGVSGHISLAVDDAVERFVPRGRPIPLPPFGREIYISLANKILDIGRRSNADVGLV